MPQQTKNQSQNQRREPQHAPVSIDHIIAWLNARLNSTSCRPWVLGNRFIRFCHRNKTGCSSRMTMKAMPVLDDKKVRIDRSVSLRFYQEAACGSPLHLVLLVRVYSRYV